MVTVINVKNLRDRLVAVMAGTYVYCGRPSKWGNPHPVGRVCRVCTMRLGTGALVKHQRGEAIEEYRKDFEGDRDYQRQALEQLPQDAVLGCFCKPLDCHCDVIAAFVNQHRC